MCGFWSLGVWFPSLFFTNPSLGKSVSDPDHFGKINVNGGLGFSMKICRIYMDLKTSQVILTLVHVGELPSWFSQTD